MEHILGQSRAVGVLQTQLASGRLHHAYIFHGPAGVGKFTTAHALTRVLLCHDRQVDEPVGSSAACGKCASCRLIGSDQAPMEELLGTAHPDLHVVVKEMARFSDRRDIRERKLTQIPIDILRSALIERAYLAPKLGDGKVFIVDEAELLNPQGQNLLLKTLEEPPSGTTIILITANEDRLLPTIRSRCQRIAFVPLGDDLVDQWIGACDEDLDTRDRRWLVRFAGGSLGRARLAIDYELAQWGREVLSAVDQLARDRPIGALGQQIAALVNAFAKDWVDRHAGASKEAANRLGADLMWSMIAAHAREELYRVASGCDPSDAAAAETVTAPWMGVIEALGRTQSLIASNVNLSLACDHLVMEMDHCFGGSGLHR